MLPSDASAIVVGTSTQRPVVLTSPAGPGHVETPSARPVPVETASGGPSTRPVPVETASGGPSAQPVPVETSSGGPSLGPVFNPPTPAVTPPTVAGPAPQIIPFCAWTSVSGTPRWACTSTSITKGSGDGITIPGMYSRSPLVLHPTVLRAARHTETNTL